MIKTEIRDITKFDNYLDKEMFKQHKKDFEYINNKIEESLKNYDNFLGIDFCDVGYGGIQIRGHHRKIKEYIFGEQPTIKYDFSNIEKVIKEFIDMWKYTDNDKNIREYQNLISFGKEYGWN